jgi:hypothetical protein
MHLRGPWWVTQLLLALSNTVLGDATTTTAATATTPTVTALADASQVVPYRYTIVHGNISAKKPTKLTTVCNFSSPNASLHDNCAEDKTAHLSFIDAENFTVVIAVGETVYILLPSSEFSRCFNKDVEGGVSKMTVSPTARW